MCQLSTHVNSYVRYGLQLVLDLMLSFLKENSNQQLTSQTASNQFYKELTGNNNGDNQYYYYYY